MVEPWSGADFDTDADWEMTWGEGRTFEQLLEQFSTSVDRSRATISAADDLAAVGRGEAGRGVSLRWILIHMIEEYARHVGHADVIREAIDAQTGD